MDLIDVFAGRVGVGAEDFLFFDGIIILNKCIYYIFDKTINNRALLSIKCK